MTFYEWLQWFTFPVRTVHLQTVRKDIKVLVSKSRKKQSILDVGGRKSPYTIGMKADITLLDVPQEEGTRKDLNLGFTDNILKNIQKKRSNISNLIIEDMTKSTLRDNSYDAVLCVEVIEHVEDDDVFVKNISKVIKPGSWAYFTTPNGDYIKNEGPGKNPDHVRHYTKEELHALLQRHFDKVEVHYAVKTGKYRDMGLKG
ncbi:MAG TPA: methyltransferase domain-containing protein, partial [Aquaticitalea sp.]|nr:methyltransferase domain-containing protein [Aquaticitalea sp.]